MKITKNTTYSWEAGYNQTEQQAREFAKNLLNLTDANLETNLPFEIAPKSSETLVNCTAVSMHCNSTKINGRSGQRIPTLEELNKIYHSENDFEKSWYWSSSKTASGDRRLKNFINAGHAYVGDIQDCYYLRLVRDL